MKFLILILFFPVFIFAQTIIEKYPDNPVLNVGPEGSWDGALVNYPSVIVEGEIYKMWYAGYDSSKYRIGYATSLDGINWTKADSVNPVLDVGPEGGWDDESVNYPCVLYDGNLYKMWYCGSNGTNYRIGFATSLDGINWTKVDSVNPVLDVGPEGSWDEYSMMTPRVIFLENEYVMFYSGMKQNYYTNIGCAKSPDGIEWTKEKDHNPVLEAESWEDNQLFMGSVLFRDNIFKMWYVGGWLSGRLRSGYATSEDGISWNKHEIYVLNYGDYGEWDYKFAAVRSVYFNGDSYQMWYDSFNLDATSGAVGYATSTIDEIDEIDEVWTPKADMLNKRQGHSSGVLDGKIYALGGIQFNTPSTHYNAIKSLEFYDTNLNEWTEKDSMNTGRVQFPTCIYDGKIWAIGGGQSVYWDPLTSIETYDPYFNLWSHKTDMPRARMGHTATLFDGKIYIIGGASSNAMIPLSEIVVYDPLTDTWDSTKTDMLTPRMNLEAVVLNGKIYVMGGHGGTPEGELGLNKVEAYDPATDQWEDKADMIRARKYFSACVVDGKIYVFGGAINCSSAWSTVEVYDPHTNKWTSGTDISTKWIMTAAASINEKIYVSGGTFQICPPSVVKTVRVYDPARDTLTEIKYNHIQQQPESFTISQNYPNPFNPSTTFKYELPKESYITLKVYDILGREVVTLVNREQKAGYYEIDWNAASNSSGIYFYRIQAGQFVETKKMVLMK